MVNKIIDKLAKCRYDQYMILHKNCRMEDFENAITIQSEKL